MLRNSLQHLIVRIFISTILPGLAIPIRYATGLALIDKVVMQLSIATDPAAFLPGLAEEFGLTSVFSSPFAQRVLQLGVKTAGSGAQVTTHRLDSELLAMLSNECVFRFASLAKYAVAFFWYVALLGNARQFFLQTTDSAT